MYSQIPTFLNFGQPSDDQMSCRVPFLLGLILAERQKQAKQIVLWNEIYFQIDKYCFLQENGAITEDDTGVVGEGNQGKCYSKTFNGTKIVVKYLNEFTESQVITEISWLHNIWCIGHPNIVAPVTLADGRVVLLLDANGMLTITMVEIEGNSIQETDFSTWTTYEKVWAFVQLADCLNVLHKYGLFHSDIHRMNIVIRNDKTPIIIDLGTMTTDEASRKMDVNGLFALLVDFQLDDDPNCPLLFSKWCYDFTEGSRTLLPDTIENVCKELGEMSIGVLGTINYGGYKVIYPCHIGDGVMAFSFGSDQLRFEDYAKKVIGPDIRARQQQAIQKYLSE